MITISVGVAGFEPTTSCSQSRRDTGLRYTPKIKPFAKPKYLNLLLSILRRVRDSNPRYPCEVRQFSKRLLSASQATLLNTFSFSFDTSVVFRLCKGTLFLDKDASRVKKKLKLFHEIFVNNFVLI
ncbi:MAG: hypothetical protein RLZZ306_1179 [Bacteroidota bacterium]